MTDFLDMNAASDAQAANKAARLEVASLYLVFTRDPVAKRLLAMWDEQLGRKRVPVNATVQEYAATEAVRAFVDGIHRQIEFATTEGR